MSTTPQIAPPIFPTFSVNVSFDSEIGRWSGVGTASYPGDIVVERQFQSEDYTQVLSALHGWQESEVEEALGNLSVYGFTLAGREESIGTSGIVATSAQEVLAKVAPYLGRRYNATVDDLHAEFDFSEYRTIGDHEVIAHIAVEVGTARWVGNQWVWHDTIDSVYNLSAV